MADLTPIGKRIEAKQLSSLSTSQMHCTGYTNGYCHSEYQHSHAADSFLLEGICDKLFVFARLGPQFAPSLLYYCASYTTNPLYFN